jgi:hypothetical protein
MSVQFVWTEPAFCEEREGVQRTFRMWLYLKWEFDSHIPQHSVPGLRPCLKRTVPMENRSPQSRALLRFTPVRFARNRRVVAPSPLCRVRYPPHLIHSVIHTVSRGEASGACDAYCGVACLDGSCSQPTEAPGAGPGTAAHPLIWLANEQSNHSNHKERPIQPLSLRTQIGRPEGERRKPFVFIFPRYALVRVSDKMGKLCHNKP